MYALRLLFLAALGLLLFPSAGVEASRAQGTAVKTNTTAIAGTIGVVSLNPNGYKKNPEVRFFNKDGGLWFQYTFEGNESTPRSARDSFRPLAFNPDYYLLVLKCVKRDDTFFEVIVDEASGLTKLVKISDGNMKFQTWHHHVLDLFAVGFDQSANPVRRMPAGRRYQMPPTNGLMFHPIQIKGNWLKIRWNPSNTKNQARTHVGWIQWRDSTNLLIEAFYTS